MRTDAFDYILPAELIATAPITPRDHSRLLVYRRATQNISHHRFDDLPELLSEGDSLVLNNSRVIPARLKAKDATGKPLEVLLLEAVSDLTWRVLVKPGKKVKPQLRAWLPDGTEIRLERTGADQFIAHFPGSIANFFAWLDTVGEPPIPPYFKRGAEAGDKDRYQTVYAGPSGSVAAPTAGLHFTPALMARLTAAGVHQHFITLHVGYGTFAPVSVIDLSQHQMHFETFEMPPDTLAAVEAKRMSGQKVIAVGTTALRTLEASALLGPKGRTNLFITPGYTFRFDAGLITNFHLPQSTLYVLVAAFIGLEETRRCYAEAIRQRYRFYSYGDAMIIL